jgi:hypothetical protein
MPDPQEVERQLFEYLGRVVFDLHLARLALAEAQQPEDDE